MNTKFCWKEPLGRPGCKWGIILKIVSKQVGWENVAQFRDPVIRSCVHGNKFRGITRNDKFVVQLSDR
jgi:hypothetical protein